MTDIVERARAELEKFKRLDREAATHVESLICMRSDRFTGEPPYVGWKGLGKALKEDYDELERLREQLSEKCGDCCGCPQADHDILHSLIAEKNTELERLRAERDAAWLAGWEAAKEKAAEIAADYRSHFKFPWGAMDATPGPLCKRIAEAIKAMEKPHD